MLARTVTLSLALALATRITHAQSVSETATADEALPEPNVPLPSAAVASRMAPFRDAVARSCDCFASYRPYAVDDEGPDCTGPYTTLARGGDAAAYVIGRALNTSRPNNVDERWAPWLVRALVATGSPLAAPMLLQYLAEAAGKGRALDPAAAAALAALPRLTGDDAYPVAPWEHGVYEMPGVYREAVRRWLQGWISAREVTPAQHLAQSAERARRDLSHPDPSVRFAAMERLVSVPAHRAAVQSALRALLADENLPAEAVSHVTRWAREHHLTLPANVSSTTGAR